MENHQKFTILITTKNRLQDLKITLKSLVSIIQGGVKVIIFDDGSSDYTSLWIKQHYPEVSLVTNNQSQGYISNRNSMLALVDTPYAISLDDDASIISENPLQYLADHFEENSECGLIAFRIYWGKTPPVTNFSTESSQRVKSFVGCGHAWRMEAWRSIPNYPSWYNFYGEEDFASIHLFKKNWEVHYLPQILVHHRADLKTRKKEKDYLLRLSSSLNSGWNNYFIFYPARLIPRRIAYSIWIQLNQKVFEGEPKVILAISTALIGVLKNSINLFKNRRPLSNKELRKFATLPDTKFYWKPENE